MVDDDGSEDEGALGDVDADNNLSIAFAEV
jgi:hypothetical protein